MNNCTLARAGIESAADARGKWSVALGHLTEALQLFDEGDAPPELGAAVDLLIHRTKDAISRDAQSGL